MTDTETQKLFRLLKDVNLNHFQLVSAIPDHVFMLIAEFSRGNKQTFEFEFCFILILGFRWDLKKKGSSIIIENNGKTARQTKYSWKNVVGDTGFSKGKHEWTLEFFPGTDWAIELVCTCVIIKFSTLFLLTNKLS